MSSGSLLTRGNSRSRGLRRRSGLPSPHTLPPSVGRSGQRLWPSARRLQCRQRNACAYETRESRLGLPPLPLTEELRDVEVDLLLRAVAEPDKNHVPAALGRAEALLPERRPLHVSLPELACQEFVLRVNAGGA